MKKFLLSAVFAASFLSASAQYTDGILVLNEGNAGTDNSNVSFIKGGVVQNGIFSAANGGAALGDTAQSLALNNGKAYIVLNISNKLVVVNAETFLEEASIEEGLTNPRYIAFYGTKAYVTCWGDGSETGHYVAVINTATNTIETTIALEGGIERIITVGDKLYVAHQGGFGFGTKVSVINPATNSVETTITVGDVPNSILEKDGFLYVLCGGKPSWSQAETSGSFHKIDLVDNTVVQTINFSDNAHPGNLELGGDNFFYTEGDNVYRMALTATTLPETAFFTITPQDVYGVYGFDIVDGKIYVADAVDYVSEGDVFMYDVDGVFGQKYDVGKLPNAICKSASAVAGNDGFNALTVSIYPNPASDVLFVNTDKSATVKLYDLTGRTVADQAQYTATGINVSQLPAGTYFAEITIENTKSVKQFIVQ
ncbi:DUF5074 domain-containing protein [Flavobacterium hauense]